jgi:hypothetical protein
MRSGCTCTGTAVLPSQVLHCGSGPPAAAAAPATAANSDQQAAEAMLHELVWAPMGIYGAPLPVSRQEAAVLDESAPVQPAAPAAKALAAEEPAPQEDAARAQLEAPPSTAEPAVAAENLSGAEASMHHDAAAQCMPQEQVLAPAAAQAPDEEERAAVPAAMHTGAAADSASAEPSAGEQQGSVAAEDGMPAGGEAAALGSAAGPVGICSQAAETPNQAPQVLPHLAPEGGGLRVQGPPEEPVLASRRRRQQCDEATKLRACAGGAGGNAPCSEPPWAGRARRVAGGDPLSVRGGALCNACFACKHFQPMLALLV